MIKSSGDIEWVLRLSATFHLALFLSRLDLVYVRNRVLPVALVKRVETRISEDDRHVKPDALVFS